VVLPSPPPAPPLRPSQIGGFYLYVNPSATKSSREYSFVVPLVALDSLRPDAGNPISLRLLQEAVFPMSVKSSMLLLPEDRVYLSSLSSLGPSASCVVLL